MFHLARGWYVLRSLKGKTKFKTYQSRDAEDFSCNEPHLLVFVLSFCIEVPEPSGLGI